MGAFSPNDHSGIMSFVGGLAILILVAVGGSLAMDGSISSVNETTMLDRQSALSEGRARIRRIKKQIADLEVQRRIQNRHAQFQIDKPKLEENLKTRHQLLSKLTKERDELRQSLTNLQDDWLEYRKQRHKVVRLRAVGEFLGDLTLTTGRTYHQVVVSKVDDKGLTIKHAGGTTRIKPNFVPEDLREELDLDLERAEAALAKERRLAQIRDQQLKTILAARKKEEARLKDPEQNPELAAFEIAEGKRKIGELIDKMVRAQQEAARARSNDQFSSHRSVTGKLETWSERATRMERAATRFRTLARREISKVKRLDPRYVPPFFE